MTTLIHWIGWGLALAAIPSAFTIWYQTDKHGHPILGTLAAATTHVGLLVLAVTCLLY